MKISIVIPNYNGEKYIKNCLESLKNQSVKQYEIIIIDNKSSDNCCKVIQDNYKDVKLIKLSENTGFSVAVNRGIKEAVGEYVVLLNNDTEVDEDWLLCLVNCIESDEKLFSCSSKMIQYNNRDKLDDAGDGYTFLGWAYKRGDGMPSHMFSKDKYIFSSCAGAAIYRKKVFEEIGYFDENFFAYMEDIDICYRAQIYGYKNKYCSNALVYHVGSGTSGSRHNKFKVKLSSRNNIYVIYKNMPLLQIIIFLPFLLSGSLIKYLFFLNCGLDKEYIEGIKNALANLKNIKRVKFKWKNLMNYIKVFLKIINSTFLFAFYKLNNKAKNLF